VALAATILSNEANLLESQSPHHLSYRLIFDRRVRPQVYAHVASKLVLTHFRMRGSRAIEHCLIELLKFNHFVINPEFDAIGTG
jgi:hypothetical protein